VRGDRLKAIRERKGLTQEELAARIGVGTQQIWRWESGSTTPASNFVADLARELSVSSDYLLGISDDPTPSIGEDDLTDIEHKVISAMRLGEKLKAIKAIVESA
jgi:transcriptional regulator with XRE-family HTH domain